MWEKLIVGAIVVACVLFLARRFSRRNQQTACAGCNRCGHDKSCRS